MFYNVASCWLYLKEFINNARSHERQNYGQNVRQTQEYASSTLMYFKYGKSHGTYFSPHFSEDYKKNVKVNGYNLIEI
jgi:hypothetical protein